MTINCSQKVSVAQLGARMHYAVPRIFSRLNQLDQLYTDICSTKGWPRVLNKLPPALQSSQVKKLIGRNPYDIPTSLITSFTSFGLEYAYRLKKSTTPTEVTAVNLWAGSQFNELILRKGFGSASLLYSYNSASKNIFMSAKKQGLTAILEQTIAPKSTEIRLLKEEEKNLRFLGWNMLEDENADRFSLREKAEWNLADIILCGSEFVRNNVVAEGGDGNKCFVVPYGVSLTNFRVKNSNLCQKAANKPLRVLFVGSLGLRKGVYYLIEAMRKLEKLSVECRIVGSWPIDIDPLLVSAPKNVKICGAIPRSEIAIEYCRADVFCLPSLCEGSATVIYEALASGLPVITTANSGSIVRDGVEGYIVPIRDASAIAEKLENFLADSRLLENMSRAAKLRSDYGSFHSYSNRLVETLARLVEAKLP